MSDAVQLDIGGFGYNVSSLGRDLAIGVIRKLQPYDVENFAKVRVGRHYDGGYVMLDDFEGISAAYSLGINDDVSWDLDIAAHGVDIYQYDHTITALPCQHKRFHWRPVGISSVAGAAPNLDTLDNLMRSNGHLDGGDLILKCDIEGHEWAMLASLDVAVLRKFRQIVIELHALRDLHDPAFSDVARRAISTLTAHHRVVHVHANNYSFYTIVGGIPLPAVMEFTLTRIDDKSLSPSQHVFPTPLDMPCAPDRPDYALGCFRF